mmetsp:Transcript_3044/g.4468  ORF Transcript_3044/g.4468 Transcript_3044/m.4468 type:complete len:384 (-) Transcript_3044:4-1155(-)
MTQHIDNYEDTDSWGESLKRYTRSKLAPLEVEQPVFTFSRTKSYMWRCAKKNPVLGIYNKPEDESEHQQKETTRRIKKMNLAKDRQLAKEAGFDLVSHKSRRQGLCKSKSELKEERQQRNLEYKRKHAPHPSRECTQDFDSLLGKRKKLSELRERSTWNLVTHDFFKANAEKRKQEKNKQLDKTWRCYDRYQTDRFDPILQKFVEPEKEKVLKKVIKQVAKNRKFQQKHALPPSLQKAQPQAYHMITGEIKNQKLTNAWDCKEKKGMQRCSKKREREQRMKSEQHQKQKLALKRTMNRLQSETRSKDQVRHGYNIINNAQFAGPQAIKPLVSLDVLKKKSMWQKIEKRPKSVSLSRKPRRTISTTTAQRPPTASALSRTRRRK